MKGCSACFYHFFYLFHRSGFDTDFMVNNDEDTGLISYIGIKIFTDNRKIDLVQNCSGKKYTKIQYDQNLYQWTISVANNPRISAVSYSDVSTMVIGTVASSLRSKYIVSNLVFGWSLHLRQHPCQESMFGT